MGRITAQVDERWDEFQGGSDGLFGFFDCDDDPEAPRPCSRPPATGCASAAATGMLGPMDFTTNDECGLLIEGYDIRR